MKKILSIFLAVLFVFGTVSVLASAAPITKDDNGIAQMSFLDFTPDTNQYWAEYDESAGKWVSTVPYNSYEQPEVDGEIVSAYLYIAKPNSGYNWGVQWSLIENGEVLHFESTQNCAYPGLQFIIDEYHDGIMPVGSESGSPAKAEYFKIRVRNYSTANRFTFGWALNHTGNGKFMPVTLSDLKVDLNGKTYGTSGEWETYIFSMPTINQETNYSELLYDPETEEPTTRWGGYMYELLLFPFGYDVDDGTGPYAGASIDIDYVVVGSLDYVTNYKSELELKEESIKELELIKAPTDTEYYVGEELDLTGLELKATYNDGTTETLTSASASVTTFSSADTTSVTLSFGKETVSFPVKVTGIESIEVVEEPTEKVYELADVADGFDSTGFTFKVNYKDGTSTEPNGFSTNNLRFTCDDLASAGTKTVNVSYFGIPTSIEIEVINVTDLEITAPEAGFRYGDEITSDDFDITLVFNNGKKIASDSDDLVTEFEYSVTCDVTVPGETTATITATNTTHNIVITKDVTVTVENPTEMKIVSDPVKKSYQPGENFDSTGMSVAFVYADGSQVIIKNEHLSDPQVDLSEPGTKKVTVRTNIAGLNKLKATTDVTVEGEVITPGTSATTPSTTAPQGGDSNPTPIIIVVVIVLVVLAGAAVVIVLLKKKKKS